MKNLIEDINNIIRQVESSDPGASVMQPRFTPVKTTAEIARVEELLPSALPRLLKEILLKNGGVTFGWNTYDDGALGEEDGAGTLYLHSPEDIAHVYNGYAKLRKEFEKNHPGDTSVSDVDKWIPFAMMRTGSTLCIDTSSHDDVNQANVIMCSRDFQEDDLFDHGLFLGNSFEEFYSRWRQIGFFDISYEFDEKITEVLDDNGLNINHPWLAPVKLVMEGSLND